MEFHERESGLVVPNEKPVPPTRHYGQFEIHDEARRAVAKEAMSKLWDAMNLSNPGGGIRLPGSNYELYEKLYRLVGEMLLGADCPEKEVKC